MCQCTCLLLEGGIDVRGGEGLMCLRPHDLYSNNKERKTSERKRRNMKKGRRTTNENVRM